MVAITPLLTDFPVMLVAILRISSTISMYCWWNLARRAVFCCGSVETQPENRAIPGKGSPATFDKNQDDDQLPQSQHVPVLVQRGSAFSGPLDRTDFWPGIVFTLFMYRSLSKKSSGAGDQPFKPIDGRNLVP